MKQQDDEYARRAMAIYGLPEEGHDLKDIYDSTWKTSCNATEVKYKRIGCISSDRQGSLKT